MELTTFQVTVELFLVPGDPVPVGGGGLLKLLHTKGEAVESTGRVGQRPGRS